MSIYKFGEADQLRLDSAAHNIANKITMLIGEKDMKRMNIIRDDFKSLAWNEIAYLLASSRAEATEGSK